MLYEIILTALIAVMTGLYIYEMRKVEWLRGKLTKLALKLVDLEQVIDRVDKSTGSAIYALNKDFTQFKTDYGEAAIEEMRQAARSEKAWADGVNNIMSYGARFQGGGNSG